MSSRQVFKHDKSKQEEVYLEEVVELEKEIAKEKSKKPTFAAFQMSDSEEENQDNSDEEKSANNQKSGSNQPTEDGQAKKKKKKRNKKKKKTQEEGQNNDNEQQKEQPKQNQASQQNMKKEKGAKGKEEKKVDDMEFLDQIIQQQKEEIKQQYGVNSPYGQDSVLKMERKNFSYKKELKQLFAKSAQAYGALGLDEEDKEERKNRGNNEDDYEGASKKMRRRLRMVEKIQEKNRVITSKKYLMVQPDPKWPRVERMLTMEHIRTNKNTGQKIFSFVKLPEYNIIEKEFKQVQSTNDIQNLMHFLQRNFYHHESLVYFADFLRIQGKFSDSFHFLERCLFAFET